MSSAQENRFTSVRTLGEGATGRVFEVFDQLHGARCALKQLRTDRVLDARHIAAFKDEFRGLTRLSHPNLARVYELLVRGPDLYVLMELIDGIDFIQYVRCEDSESAVTATQSEQDAPASPIRGGSLSLLRLRSALQQLANGIVALHATGRIHCDLKPENVLVDNAGRVAIVDFGLTSVPTRDPARKPRGTPHYMAPEQMDGWPSEAADWYAFGVILYVALTGRLPFGGPTKTVDYEKRFGRLVDPRQIASGLPDDLCELSVRLLSADPRKRPTGDAVARALGVEQPPESSDTARSQSFVGRAAHLAALELALAQARDGEACVAFVHGESGIGKTTLLRHFLDQVQRQDQGALILQGACYQDASVPYKGLDAIMDRIASDLARHAPLLAGLDMDALTTMFPVFGHTSESRAPSARHPFELRERAVAGVRALFERLASAATTVLSIDDLQWADEETIALLTEIVRQPAPRSLLVILGHRSQTSPHEGRVAEARAAIPCHYDLHIGPLERDDVRALVTALLDRDLRESEIDEVAGDCIGNPLLLKQLVHTRATQAGARVSLDDVVASRIAGLNETQRAYVELVSLAGRPIDEQVVAHIVSGSGADVLTARHSLIGDCFIRRADTQGGAVEPYHDQIRERVVKAIPAARAKRHHARLAVELEARSEAEPESLALHFRAAGETAKALLYTKRAADAAAQALAFERAVALYESAITMASGEEADSLRVNQADAFSNAGRALDAAATFLDVSLRRPSDIDLRVRAGDELLRAGQMDQGFALLREIAESIGERIPKNDLLTQLALVWNGWRLFRVRIPDAAVSRKPTPLQEQQLALCMSVAGRLAMVDTPAGALFQRRYLLLALEFGSIVDIARGLALEASFCAHMPRLAPGGPERAIALNVQCRALIKDADAPDVAATALFVDAMVGYRLGRWAECRISMERAIDVLRQEVVTGVRWNVAICQSFIGFMLWMEGDVPGIRSRIQEFMTAAAGHLSLETAMAHRVGVMLALCDDDAAGARRLACEMTAKWPPGPWRLQHYFDATAQIEIDLYEGRLTEAWERAANSWRKSWAAGVFHQRFFVPFTLVQRARIALAAGWYDRAARDIRALAKGHGEWATALGRVLRSALIAARGNNEEALEALRAGERDANAWSLGLYVHAARWRLGALTGEPEVTRAARDALVQLGIRNPERIVDTFLPWPTGTAPMNPAR